MPENAGAHEPELREESHPASNLPARSPGAADGRQALRSASASFEIAAAGACARSQHGSVHAFQSCMLPVRVGGALAVCLALHREFDQSIDQLGIAQTARFPKLRIHADLVKPRNRVEL